MNDTLLRALAVVVVGSVVLTGSSAAVPKTGVSRAPADLSDLLNDYHGRVLILLLGRDGCPGTAKATAALNQYVSSKPERVSVVRLNVPLPKETLKPTSDPKRPFPYFVDTGRKIAGKLEFFYYPTLYVFDGQGKQRYVGGCDKDKIATMSGRFWRKSRARRRRSIRFQCRPLANRRPHSPAIR